MKISRAVADGLKGIVCLPVLFATLPFAVVGCAGNRFLQTPGTPPGTYTIPITGTSGSLAHTHNLTLIVKAAS